MDGVDSQQHVGDKIEEVEGGRLLPPAPASPSHRPPVRAILIGLVIIGSVVARMNGASTDTGGPRPPTGATPLPAGSVPRSLHEAAVVVWTNQAGVLDKEDWCYRASAFPTKWRASFKANDANDEAYVFFENGIATVSYSEDQVYDEVTSWLC
jgi:hypothetical protein